MGKSIVVSRNAEELKKRNNRMRHHTHSPYVTTFQGTNNKQRVNFG